MHSPKLSIITVVYNAAATLPKTVESVLSQTFADYEWVIVDGGSKDGTIEMLQEIRSTKVRWMSEKDKGIYDAMNKGIRMAAGEWVYFLGGDDVFHSNDILEKVFRHDLAEIDFLYGNVFDLTLRRKYDGPFDRQKIGIRNICHQSIFYRKTVFTSIGNFNPAFRLMADWDLNLRCFHDPGVRIQYIPDTIAFFAAGGASAAYDDINFFRHSLFHYRLSDLQAGGMQQLRNIQVFDRWWRLVRSMRIKKDEDISEALGLAQIPQVFTRMILFQQSIPYSLLKNGMISKSLMSLHYLTCRLQNLF